jgi:hypothetical protein
VALKIMKCSLKFVRPAVGFSKILRSIFDLYYSGLKKNEMWDKGFVTTAVGLGQIFEINVITAVVRRMKCGAKCIVRPAVRLNFGANVTTAALI